MSGHTAFSGKTPHEASNKLWEAVRATAIATGVQLELSVGQNNTPGLMVERVARATSAPAGSFYLNICFHETAYVPFQIAANPNAEFGSGQLTHSRGLMPLILKRQSDGLFQWWTEAYSPDGDEIVRPFALTPDYIEATLKEVEQKEAKKS
jgi:hypothetical protein